MPTATFPALFKKSSKGALQFWDISVSGTTNRATITTKHGQVDGKTQEATDVVTEGKNIGKANETTPYEQACSEAKSKWEKQVSKKGYVESRTRALAGADDFKGGEKVMLADKYWDPRTRELDQGAKIVFPCDGQAKLDGHRCNAKIVNGKCSLWSRGHEPITGVPHINAALEQMFEGQTVDLDGELYNHDYKDNFEELSGFITSETPKEGHEVVEYHVYDKIDTSMRSEHRRAWINSHIPQHHAKIIIHKTIEIADAGGVEEALKKFLDAGYEGLMLRNRQALYVGKRSVDLQKVKITDDAEFEVVDVKEGRGKMKGLAIFTCKTASGVEFDAKMKGKLSSLKEYYQHPDKYIGQMLTVLYQGFYNSGKPRFPRAEAGRIRKPGF